MFSSVAYRFMLVFASVHSFLTCLCSRDWRVNQIRFVFVIFPLYSALRSLRIQMLSTCICSFSSQVVVFSQRSWSVCTFQINRNSDNTISIFATDVDPAVKPGSFAEISRRYAIAAWEIYKIEPIPSYNAELVKQLTPAMQAKIKKLGTPILK